MKKIISIASAAVIVSLLSGCIVAPDHGRGAGWGHDRGWHHGHHGYYRR